MVARALRALAVDRISLKLGINIINHDAMRERAFVSAAGAFIDTIRDTRPDVPILLISPVLCPMVEGRPGPTLREDGAIRTVDRPDRLAFGALTVRRVRQILADLVARRRDDGDLHLSYLDGLELLGHDDADRLHAKRLRSAAENRLTAEIRVRDRCCSSHRARRERQRTLTCIRRHGSNTIVTCRPWCAASCVGWAPSGGWC